MRRGGILIVGVILALAAAGLLFFVLSQPSTSGDGNLPEPTEDPGVSVVFARVDIPANTIISDTTVLELDTISSEEYNANPDEFFRSVAEVQGKLTVNTININARVTSSDLTEPGLSQQIPTAEAEDRPRPKAYAFRTDSLNGVADQITPGDFVDVVATFIAPRRVSYPTGTNLEDQAGQTVNVIERELQDLDFFTTKTIVQQAQVLRIVRPAVTEEGTPGPEEAQEGIPETDETGQPIDQTTPGGEGAITPGSWLLVLAVSDQETELIEFALNTDADISFVLRGAGDTDFEPTIGATFDLLVSEFGVPLPEPLPPRVYGEEVFEANPTSTPAPTRVP